MCNLRVLLMAYIVIVVIGSAQRTQPEHHVIPHEDIMTTADIFSEEGVTSYSQLLFDIARKQMVVGARDNLYRLDLDGLKKIEATRWPATEDKVQLCLIKGQSVDDCRNYVKVLLATGKKLFVCGTGAFSPQCTWREMENATNIIEAVRGVGKCPYSPLSNITAMITLNGQYFAGSPMDFSGADSAIVRDLGATYLRTKNYDSKWLNEPQFVGSFETDAYVYFLFRESAVEYINCGKRVYSRIARVCKNDVGGQTMMRDNWTTFVKARLNCSLPGEYPFYFDEIQGMTYLPDEGLVYATFTTPSNGIAGSAVCSFSLTAINAAFNGPFKHQATVDSEWARYTPPNHQPNHGQCQRQDPNQILDSSRYQLMDNAVQPTTLEPLYYKPLEILTQIAVDVVATKPHGTLKVLYLATSSGTIKKITILPKTSVTCTLEEWNLFPEGFGSQIMALHFIKVTESIYVGTKDRVLKIPAQHCGRHRSKEACMNAMDPYCGWNEHVDKCQPPTNGNILEHSWRQDVTKCPDRSRPVDGGWSSWSAWSQCIQNINGKDSADQCLCSSRSCNNPEPKFGGADCQGSTIQVTNCTVHGQWSSWSDWSACTQSCGSAVKVRKRTCGNPAPAFGGRVCVGRDTEEIFCHSNPPCPVLPPIIKEPSWSSWGPWSKCSAKCGGGFRQRSRYCNNPSPREGQDCSGCSEEYELCNQKPCVESKKVSSWTPWISTGNSTHKRFRFSCRTQQDQTSISIIQDKEESKLCQDGACHRLDQVSDLEESWSEWSNWSSCSSECGGGNQIKTRTCEGSSENCEGPTKLTRPCNTQKCKGEWSCWTDYGECSVTCGEGVRKRTRFCMVNGIAAEGCEGSSVSQEPCYMPCEAMVFGWDNWSEWSVCDIDNQKHRTRKCLLEQCLGSDVESIPCFDANVIQVSSSSTLLICLLSFIMGALLAFLSLYVWIKRQKPKLPSSPHYITSKQNPYVTVPMKDYRSPAKRTPSFTKPVIIGQQQNGTLPKLFAKPAEYETATIKRNSHSLINGHMRSTQHDLEQEKFF
ncbi:semaphorin-5A-like [Daktulosphaira vitifoliae]|uniref:semaphorin-5A-like n=1 Tax=Daktulosphaira vitifoliae TaxID=58002 RepID=UPI0021A9CAC0|nr:semaphorin-5A-like [Daktulosphaira vitifoliae]